MTRTEIGRMSTEELKALAMERSKRGVKNYTANALYAQKVLLERMNCCYMDPRERYMYKHDDVAGKYYY